MAPTFKVSVQSPFPRACTLAVAWRSLSMTISNVSAVSWILLAKVNAHGPHSLP